MVRKILLAWQDKKSKQQFWGAQAASLFFSAACRKALQVTEVAR